MTGGDRRTRRRTANGAGGDSTGTLRTHAPANARRPRTPLATVGGKTRVRPPGAAWLAEILVDIEHEPADALTHGFHAYPARMHPAVPRRILERFASPGAVVLDPFAGAGTVLVECMVRGCAAMGTDVNPVALRIASARTTVWPSPRIGRFVTMAQEISDAAFQDARKRVSRPLSPAARRHRDWFAPHVLQELMALDARIRLVSGRQERALAMLLLSAILVKVSFRQSETVEARIEKRIGRGTTSRLFGRKAVELGERLRALAAAVPPGTPPSRIGAGDARELRVADASIDLVITSPPYAGTYDYSRLQALRLAWLDESPDFMKDHEIGARHGRGGVKAWARDEARVVREMARVLKPGGRAFLVAGDGVLEGKPFREDRGLARVAGPAGLIVEAVASQARPHINHRVERVFRGAPRFEHLVVLKKQEKP